MTSNSTPRWVLSFVDLCLVLLGFFVMLHAQAGHQAQLLNGLKSTFSGSGALADRAERFDAAPLFEPREAILNPAALARLQTISRNAVLTHAHVRIESEGTDAATSRFDSWELAAARTAAVGRALRAAGLAEDRITVSIPEMRAGIKGDRQRISIINSAN
jgi:hypothetical protein